MAEKNTEIALNEFVDAAHTKDKDAVNKILSEISPIDQEKFLKAAADRYNQEYGHRKGQSESMQVTFTSPYEGIPVLKEVSVREETDRAWWNPMRAWDGQDVSTKDIPLYKMKEGWIAGGLKGKSDTLGKILEQD